MAHRLSIPAQLDRARALPFLQLEAPLSSRGAAPSVTTVTRSMSISRSTPTSISDLKRPLPAPTSMRSSSS